MGGDWLLQPAEYARTITEQARTRPQHRDVAFHTCGLLVRIEVLDFANKTEKLRSLMTGNVYGAVKGTAVDIHDFEALGSPISTATGVDRYRNKNLIAALENVQLVMEVFYSPAFENYLLSDSDCHKYIFDVTILVFNPQFVYVKYVTNTLVHVSLQDASSYIILFVVVWIVRTVFYTVVYTV
jgi:hypothetical protein